MPPVKDILEHPEDYDPEMVKAARWLHSPEGEAFIAESDTEARSHGIEPYPAGHPKYQGAE